MNTASRHPSPAGAGKLSVQFFQKSRSAALKILTNFPITNFPITTIIAPGEYFISPAMP
jgi:hypothetical protein